MCLKVENAHFYLSVLRGGKKKRLCANDRLCDREFETETAMKMFADTLYWIERERG